LGLCLLRRGQLKDGIDCYRGALDSLAGYEHSERLSKAIPPAIYCRFNLCWPLAEMGEFRQALRYAEQALHIADELQHPHGQLLGHYSVCTVLATRGEFADAIAQGESALGLIEETGIHLWFDREVTTLPHATLLDRTMQWMFNKDAGRYLQLVVSASRDLTNLARHEIVDIAIGDLRLYFPRVRDARLLKAHVVKEQRATFSPAPETEALRPGCRTAMHNVFLAGDWTRTGWPATMEGAVRSGYLAAEAFAQAFDQPAGKSAKFLVADIA
jgi:tetratricopeptide (TPR) repeat protein